MQTFHSLHHTKAVTSGVWVIIPVKSLTEAKSRLATAFTPLQRYRLTINLLKNTLKVLGSSVLADILAGLVVVSADQRVLQEAESYGALALNERDLIGLESRSAGGQLNATLKATSQWVINELSPGRLVIVHADLPLLDLEDLPAMLALSNKNNASVVLAPDRHEQGTNALLIEAAGAPGFNYLFGPNSFQLHCKALSKRQVSFEVCRQAGLAFDLDQLEDFDRLPASLKESLLL